MLFNACAFTFIVTRTSPRVTDSPRGTGVSTVTAPLGRGIDLLSSDLLNPKTVLLLSIPQFSYCSVAPSFALVVDAQVVHCIQKFRFWLRWSGGVLSLSSRRGRDPKRYCQELGSCRVTFCLDGHALHLSGQKSSEDRRPGFSSSKLGLRCLRPDSE